MISEGSCDIEDWSNDAKIQLCITRINYFLKRIKIENNDVNYNISHYFTLLLIK